MGFGCALQGSWYPWGFAFMLSLDIGLRISLFLFAARVLQRVTRSRY